MESFIANWATLSSDGILGTALPLLAEAGKWLVLLLTSSVWLSN